MWRAVGVCVGRSGVVEGVWVWSLWGCVCVSVGFVEGCGVCGEVCGRVGVGMCVGGCVGSMGFVEGSVGVWG